MKNIKKYKLIIILVFAAGFMINTAGAGAVGDFARSRMSFEYAGRFILTHPQEQDPVTTSPRMSFLGACDRDFPFYINGEEISVTENGFWSYYASLDMGANFFLFENGDYYESIVVTREEPEPWLPTEAVYFTIELYGSTESPYISRFADLNDDLYMRTPLARGTTFRIIAEYGDFYIIEDGTAVFKSNVYQLSRLVPPITVSGGDVSSGGNDVTLSFDVTDNPLYEIVLDENGENNAVVLLYAAHDEITLEPDGEYLTEFSKIETESDSPLMYELSFTGKPVGFTVDFSDGKMNLRFRFAARSLSEAFVLLDAGHGGHLPGALGPPGEYGPMEKDLNLYVSEVTQNYLETRGIRTFLIRDKDEDVPIMERVAFFDSTEPDISVSVHANSIPISADFSSERGPLMFYTLDLSEKAADDMIKVIADGTDNPYTAAKRQNFAMARYTGAPSMLFEMGFMCNPREYEVLIDVDYLDKMGESLGLAIVEYLESVMTSGLSEAAELSELNESEAIDESEALNITAREDINGENNYDNHDAQPALQQSGIRDNFNQKIGGYVILISSVLICGGALCLPSFIKRRK